MRINPNLHTLLIVFMKHISFSCHLGFYIMQIFQMYCVIFSSSYGPWKICSIIKSTLWTSYLNLLFQMHVKKLVELSNPSEKLLYVSSELVRNSWSICTLWTPRNNFIFCNSSVTPFPFIITMSPARQMKTSS